MTTRKRRRKTLTKPISMRLAPQDAAALDAVSSLIPMPRLTIARIALRLGLAELREHPTRVLELEPKKVRRRAKTRS
jgi:hypothetical protein